MTMTDWDDAEFARHCAALRQLRDERGWLTEAELDDLETELQCATLDLMIAERKKKHDEAAISARAFEPGRYPHLHSVARRAGRVGADRFRGRYVPHLIVDNDVAEPVRGS